MILRLVAILAALFLIGCASPNASPAPTATPTITPTPTPTATPTPSPTPTPEGYVRPYRVDVLNRYPHDTGSFTQGLVWADGTLYESAGRYAESDLREVNLTSGTVIRSVDVAPEFFAEGLALVGDELIQITWQQGTAFVYDAATFTQQRIYTYTGEGWGLCFDGTLLYMSDGSATISIRDPQSFEIVSTITVTQSSQPVTQLNELECVGDSIYANVWQTDTILQIDKASGIVIGQIDASGLLTDEESMIKAQGGVLNGIAYIPERDTFLITGKLWPALFEVKFIPTQ